MRLALALLVAALVVLAGCAHETAEDTTAKEGTQTAEDVTPDDVSAEADDFLLDETDTVEIGEML